MDKKELKDLKKDFEKLIKNVKPKHDNELLQDLIILNEKVEHHDGFIKNTTQGIGRFFKFDIKRKQKSYTDDILDNYHKYSVEEKNFIKEGLIELVKKYDKLNRTFIDKIVSVLRAT